VRYKVWRCNKDKELYLIWHEGPAAFNALPAAIRHLGPWSRSKEGAVDRPRLPLRLLLAGQEVGSLERGLLLCANSSETRRVPCPLREMKRPSQRIGPALSPGLRQLTVRC
jgi:hypothetical protein